MAFLCIDPIEGGETRRFQIHRGETTIGRHPDCSIVVDAGAVSRMHARVTFDGSAYLVEDAGSRNGTFLNGELLDGPHPLEEGDRIRISDVEFYFLTDLNRMPNAQTPTSVPPFGVPTPSKESTSMTFDGQQFGIVMVDEESEAPVSKVEFKSDGDGLKMTATPDAKLRALIRITTNLGNALSLDEILPSLLLSLFEIFPAADRGFVVLEEDGDLLPRWVKSRRGDDDANVRISKTIIRQVMDSGSSILSMDAADDSRFDSSKSIADFSIRSLICAPLVDADGKSFGALQIDSSRGQGQFREEDVDLFSGIAAQAGIVINNAKMHEQALAQAEVEQDLRLATDVQKAFLPIGEPEAPGFSVASYYKAAHHIGGDYFDYVPLPGGRVAVVVADVVGHGVAAAMFMAKLSAETRFCLASEPDVAKAIENLNNRMSELLVERFVTFIVVVIDPNDECVTIVNAGHMPPIVRRSDDGTVCEPGHDESGLPIAIADGMDYQSVRFPFYEGDVFVLYTDGVNEAMDPNDNEFGMEKVRQMTASGGSSSEVVKRIVDAVTEHVDTAAPFDDMALVVVQRTDASPTETADSQH